MDKMNKDDHQYEKWNTAYVLIRFSFINVLA